MSDLLNLGVKFMAGESAGPPSPCCTEMTNTGYCVWRWTDGRWVVQRNRCAKNCVPQEPSAEGRFQGQYRAVICNPDQCRSTPSS